MLTYLKIKNLPPLKKICDERGLYLTKSSAKYGKWSYRFTMLGRAREMGLGPTLKYRLTRPVLNVKNAEK